MRSAIAAMGFIWRELHPKVAPFGLVQVHKPGFDYIIMKIHSTMEER